MNTVMKIDRSGIGYLANQEKKAQTKQQQQHKSKPKPKKCFECGQESHFAHECQTPPPQPLPKHARPFAFNAHYMLRKDSNGKMKVMFLGPPTRIGLRKFGLQSHLLRKSRALNKFGSLNKLDLLCVGELQDRWKSLGN